MATNPIWIVGHKCWAPDPDRVYVPATISASAGGKVKVDAVDGSFAGRDVKPDELLPQSGEHKVVSNMDNLGELHLASVLNNVERLFGQPVSSKPGYGHSAIYSSVGPMLIAMNPFKELPIYGLDWMTAYRQASGNEQRNAELGPHCYQTVEEAYMRLKKGIRQSVIICGESGAGKTVTNRKMIDYLCTVAKPSDKGGKFNGADPEAITEANVLLESFGNAKTTRNENSSRFGKYSRMIFQAEHDYQISGCMIDHYLLERSRVTSHEPTERNYHIFYQLMKGGKHEQFKVVTDPDAYAFTKASAEIKGQDDAEDFGTLWNGMQKSGFSDEMRADVFKVVAAVLHIGNIEFTGDKNESEIKPCEGLKAASELLNIDEAKFSKAIVHQLIQVTGSDPIWKPLGLEDAQAQRNTVAKTLYSRMFDQIVTFLGKALNKSGGARGSILPHTLEAVIGLLDIFGFEDMTVNGFEQMFINLTNERIQHLFNGIMFEREMEAYKKEGITALFDPGDGNLETVKLFTSKTKPSGIVKLLSDSVLSRGGGRDGEAFVSLLNKTFSQHPSFVVCDPKRAQQVVKEKGLKKGTIDYRECFCIKHYAGTIAYTVNRWVPKSVDALPGHLAEVIASSKNGYVAELFAQNDEMGKATVGEKFVKQLETLADQLDAGGSLFVRCIKSNPEKLPGLMNRRLVLEQLVNGGVISALWMRHQGLPDRVDYQVFVEEFDVLMRNAKGSAQEITKAILIEIFGEDSQLAGEFAFGYTKVFMKTHINSFLRSLIALRWRITAQKVQRRWRIKMATFNIKKITSIWEEFQALQKEINDRGLASFPSIAEALFQGQLAINPAVSELEELQQKFGKNVEKIAAGLSKKLGKAIKPAVEKTRDALDKVVVMKNEADAAFGARIIHAMSGLQVTKKKVEKILAECEQLKDAVSPDELKSIQESGKASLAKINKAMEKDFKDIECKGITQTFIETEGKMSLVEANIAPEVNRIIEDIEKGVAKLEEISNEVLNVRVKFQQDVEDILPKLEESEKSLEGLSAEVSRFVAEGFSALSDKVNEVWKLKECAEDLLSASKEAEKFRQAVMDFCKGTAEIVELVEASKAELQKREAERTIRLELQENLSTLRGVITTCKKEVQTTLIGQFGDARGNEAMTSLDDMLDQADKMDQSTEELQVYRSGIENLQASINKFVQEIRTLIKGVQQERKDAFSKRMGMFNKGAPAKKEPDKLQTPEEFIKKEGMQGHNDNLLEVSEALTTMRFNDATRASVKRCADHFLKFAYSSQATNPADDDQADMSAAFTVASFQSKRT